MCHLAPPGAFLVVPVAAGGPADANLGTGVAPRCDGDAATSGMPSITCGECCRKGIWLPFIDAFRTWCRALGARAGQMIGEGDFDH